jgi:ligand-binding SRPBCC domain-containing protein
LDKSSGELRPSQKLTSRSLQEISTNMTHHFETEHWLSVPIERVFLFFANPANLPWIMPPSTGARLVRLNLVALPGTPGVTATITDQEPIAGVGSQIVVSIRVLPFLPLRMNWTSEVTEFEWNQHFADVQRKGPFKSFHHRHELRSERDGTSVRDAIEYEVSFGWLGALVDWMFVRPLIRRTFLYRQRQVERLLGNAAD